MHPDELDPAGCQDAFSTGISPFDFACGTLPIRPPSAPPVAKPPVQASHQSPRATSSGLVILMWAFAIGAFFLGAAREGLLGTLCDLSAIVVACILLLNGNRADKKHANWLLSLEAACMAFGFLYFGILSRSPNSANRISPVAPVPAVTTYQMNSGPTQADIMNQEYQQEINQLNEQEAENEQAQAYQNARWEEEKEEWAQEQQQEAEEAEERQEEYEQQQAEIQQEEQSLQSGF